MYAAALGVDIDNLLVSQPDTGEQALEITEALVRSGAIDVIVLDSVAALVTKQEIEGEMGDSHVGVQARLMSQALRKLAGAISKSNCVAIFINQLREKVGVVYGNPEVTPGGRALKFYSSVRIDIRKIEVLKSGGEMIGSRTRAKVVKTRWLLRLGRLSSTSCTARVFPELESFWTWLLRLMLSIKAELGSALRASALVRAEIMSSSCFGRPRACKEG